MIPRSANPGFTLIEGLTVALIFAAILFFLIPRAVRDRRSQAARECRAHLELVMDAKQNWHNRDYSKRGEAATWDDLIPAWLAEQPTCPSGARITIGGMEESPRCTSNLPGHTLHEKSARSRKPEADSTAQGDAGSSVPPRTALTPIPE